DSGSTLVELLEFKSHRFKSDTDHEIFSIGPSHLALTVDDLDAVYHRLSEAGVHFNAPPQISTEGRVKVTFCQDPDGTPIELVQELKSED
ncbi:MAG TPA: hypothetical protein EYN74_02130, partial [Nitrospirales bacterium]|nr:hypothetical protein [Nitrospirales bacterium]